MEAKPRGCRCKLRNAKNSWQPPEAGRDKGVSLRSSRETLVLPTPWLWTSGLQNCGRIKFCCLSQKACGHLLQLIQGRCTERIRDCRAEGSGKPSSVLDLLLLTEVNFMLQVHFLSVPHMPGPHSWARGSHLTWRSYSKSKEVRWDTPYLFGTVVTGITTLVECWIHTRYVYTHYLV